MYRRLGGESEPNQEIVLFRSFVRARARSGCLVRFDLKSWGRPFLFCLLPRRVFPFPLCFSRSCSFLCCGPKANRREIDVKNVTSKKMEWTRSDIKMSPKWIRSEFWSEIEVNRKWIRSESEVTSKLRRNEINVKSKWLESFWGMKSTRDRSEFEVKAKWSRS